jgi:hypothetical protein
MRRQVTAVLTVSALVLLTLALTPAIASAGRPNRFTVALACDHGEGATADVTLQTSTGDFAGGTSLLCGTESPTGVHRARVVISGPLTATTAAITSFSGTFDGSCATTVTLPARVSCPGNGSAGASLSVR